MHSCMWVDSAAQAQTAYSTSAVCHVTVLPAIILLRPPLSVVVALVLPVAAGAAVCAYKWICLLEPHIH
jgi:hypothetical protein